MLPILGWLTTPEHEICPGVADTPGVTALEKTHPPFPSRDR